MKKWLIIAVNFMLIMGALLVFSENFLYCKGYNFDYIIHNRHLETDTPKELRELRQQTGWGFEKSSHPSQEDPAVTETIWANGMRECRSDINKKGHKKIAILGCSWTYGMGVTAPETYVYRLNEAFPDTVIDNYGVNGFGTYQCLLTEETLLKNNDYDLFIYAAISPHIHRNIIRQVMGQLSRNQPYVVRPRVELDDKGIAAYYPASYFRWPLEDRLLTVDFLKRAWYATHCDVTPSPSSKEFKTLEEKENRAMILLTEEMNRKAHAQNKDFAVMVLENLCEHVYGLDTKKLSYPLLYCGEFDSSDPANHVLGKLESHPSAKIHAYWAEEIGNFLRAKGYH